LLTELVLGYQRKDYESVIEALRTGAMKPEKMITSKIKIDRIAEDGFKPLIEEKDKHVKILVDMRA
jgi:threonine dehydrogenase-like Zn-dependent dehydrogenase